MTDWKLMAQARGLTLDDAQIKSLDLLEKDFAPVRDGIDWQDEPAVEFHAEND